MFFDNIIRLKQINMMEIFWTVLPAVILLLLILGLSTAIILLLAHLGWYFSKVEQGSVVFINKGDAMKAVWPNVGGYKLSKSEDFEGRRWLVRTESKEEKDKAFFYGSSKVTLWFQKILWNKFGMRFIGIFWPYEHVHEFEIDRKRLVEGADEETGKVTSLRARIIPSPNSNIVDSLRFLIPRPVFIEGIELAGDNSKIDLVLLPVFQLVIPALPIYYYKGNFFKLLDGAIEAAIVDFFATHRVAVHRETKDFAHDTYDPNSNQDGMTVRDYKNHFLPSPLTYAHWLKMKKSENSPIDNRLRLINATSEYYTRLKEASKKDKGKEEIVNHLNSLTYGMYESKETGEVEKKMPLTFRKIPGGIVPRYGFALTDFRLIDWAASGETKELSDSLLKKQIEQHTAEGVREEAYGIRDAIMAKGFGESERYTNIIDSLIQKGIDPETAAGFLETLMRTENIKGSKVNTYVESGGGRPPVVVGTNPDTQNKDTDQPSN